MKFIKKVIIVILATSGIRIDNLNLSRLTSLFLVITGYVFYLLFATHFSLTSIFIYFFSLFVIRYVYLFWGFMHKGFSGEMIKKFGARRAWNIYELFTSLMFFQRGLSFGLLTSATRWSLLAIPGIHIFPHFVSLIMTKYILIGAGIVLIVIGYWINVSASLVIGIDTYYYKDLFLKKAIVPFKKEGPYKLFSNPMYGIGQSSGYGAALMIGSLPGILVTFLNQVTMYLFYFLIEKPHIKAIFKSVSI